MSRGDPVHRPAEEPDWRCPAAPSQTGAVEHSRDGHGQQRADSRSEGSDERAFDDELRADAAPAYSHGADRADLVGRSITFMVIVLTTAKSTITPITSAMKRKIEPNSFTT